MMVNPLGSAIAKKPTAQKWGWCGNHIALTNISSERNKMLSGGDNIQPQEIWHHFDTIHKNLLLLLVYVVTLASIS